MNLSGIIRQTIFPLYCKLQLHVRKKVNLLSSCVCLGNMNSIDSKRFKPNDCNEKDAQHGINDLSIFKFVRILADHGQRKTICVEGTLKDREGKAVLWLEKLPFSEESVKSLCTNKSLLDREFLNDIYGSYTCKTDPDINVIKATIIYPATDQHIAKFEDKPFHIIEETPELYNDVTLPYILKEQFDIQWVYNVLEHKHETERIVFEDEDPNTGFVLLPDLKWSGKQTEDLYLLALVHPRNIKSLRDLTAEHLPLLRNILNKGREAIAKKYNLPKSQLRIYIHYQPTFYHLHVHFTYLKYEAPEKFHLKMAYQVIVEYRPKIRACQFFVKAKLNQDSIEIILKDNIALILSGHNTTEITFPKSVQHIVNSVSGLNFMEDSICFRTRTNPDKMFGTFERELILSNEEESIHNYVPQVQVGKTVIIFCRQCLSALSKEVCFERRLPLPLFSSAEDYFCHHKPSTEDILNPRLKDCLYGLYFYKINPAVFECDILEGNVFVCPNCSSWLGISALGFVQLWNSTTILNDSSPMASGDDVALQDFLNLIEVATSEKHAGCKTNKLILYCTGVADCSTDQYLLIWIMEKKLNIFTSKNPVSDQTKLKHDKVCKVLYLFENHKSEKVNEWLNFNEANCVPISKNMFVEGHEHLKRMSFNIPTKFRSANNMYVSYIGNLK